MTFLTVKIILGERSNGSLVRGGTESRLFFSQKALAAAKCRAMTEAALHLVLWFTFCRAGGAVGWQRVWAQCMWEELWSVSNSWLQWGTFRIYSNATDTCFRLSVYSRKTQHDPGSLMPVLIGAASRTAYWPVLEAERPVPVLPNMVTAMNMNFFRNYQQVSVSWHALHPLSRQSCFLNC